MTIDKLINTLEKIKEKHGNIECVQEIEEFYNKKINSTVENVRIVQFNGEKAAMVDWRR